MAAAPIAQFFRGAGAMDVTVRPENGQAFRLVYVRMHFRGLGGAGETSDLVLSLDSAAGEEYDVELYHHAAGLDADVNLIFTEAERTEPSPWSVQPGDGVRVRWVPPTLTEWTWGLEVGIEVLTG